MKKDQVLGLLRHALTFAGAILISKGVVSNELVGEISGAILSLISAVWSVSSKNTAE